MDLYITGVWQHANQTELRIFLREPLQRYHIPVYDLTKLPEKEWAILTIPDEAKARKFLGPATRENLMFFGERLIFRANNIRGQPDALKVAALKEEERKLQAKSKLRDETVLASSPPTANAPLWFLSLSLGIWGYDYLQKLIFDRKLSDKRRGTVS